MCVCVCVCLITRIIYNVIQLIASNLIGLIAVERALGDCTRGVINWITAYLSQPYCFNRGSFFYFPPLHRCNLSLVEYLLQPKQMCHIPYSFAIFLYVVLSSCHLSEHYLICWLEAFKEILTSFLS